MFSIDNQVGSLRTLGSVHKGHRMSIGISPFEVMYGRKCKTSISWTKSVDWILVGPELLKEMEQKIARIKA